jgi:adenosylmethionine-8-amino-7-oxononanoate aminotransferase
VFEAFWSDDPKAALMHGPTFMANPLACAAANASLDIFELEPRLEQVAALSGALAEGLSPCADAPGVVDVRVKGAIGVVELERMSDLGGLKRRLVELGVWVRPFGRIVYLTPAFTIERSDIDRLCAAIHKAIATSGGDVL